MKTFYSNGKLLLTSEYLVLDGALALAIPTKFGQSLTVKNLAKHEIIWKSHDHQGTIWFEGRFSISQNNIKHVTSSDIEISNRLLQILNAAKKLNVSFLNTGFEVTTTLNFQKNWGLGTSSTLINNIAQWAQIDPYKLLGLTFGGSGFDVACAQNNTPITYQLNNSIRLVNLIDFNPPFKSHLYFVYLNRKQNSRESIASYKQKMTSQDAIEKASRLTQNIIQAKDLKTFCNLIEAHEILISNLLNINPIKQMLFPNFKGSIKSLGGWGGDFILAVSQDNPLSYFESKGFKTVIPYSEMVLK